MQPSRKSMGGLHTGRYEPRVPLHYAGLPQSHPGAIEGGGAGVLRANDTVLMYRIQYYQLAICWAGYQGLGPTQCERTNHTPFDKCRDAVSVHHSDSPHRYTSPSLVVLCGR